MYASIWVANPRCAMKVNVGGKHLVMVHHRPIWILLIDLSKSISVGTRKMVNYA